jgi:predicted SnoaL-like aldol condensation-catalyzing enzyme
VILVAGTQKELEPVDFSKFSQHAPQFHHGRSAFSRYIDIVKKCDPTTKKAFVCTVHKDLSLISLVPKWSGFEVGVPLNEFFASIEGLAQIGRWEDSDKIGIAILKLIGAEKLFYN